MLRKCLFPKNQSQTMQNAIIHHKNFAECNGINAHNVGLKTRRPFPMAVNYLKPRLMFLNFSKLARFLLQYNLDSDNRLRAIFKLIYRDNIMPDLTLDEYRGLSKDELSQALREEGLKMFGNSWIERDFPAKENDWCSLRSLESKQQKRSPFVFSS